jgi:broad specificity phosphatase PhoE
VRRTLLLARHGETDWNATGRWQGHTDVPLNENGRAQARALAVTLRDRGVRGVVASDLQRAHETARIVAVELGLEVAYVDAALRERAFGIFEGLTREQCETLHAEAWRLWLEEKRTPHGAEDAAALTVRTVAALGRVAERVAGAEAPALVVSHGGAVRAVVAAATGTMPPPVRNGGVWCVTWEAGALVGAEPL